MTDVLKIDLSIDRDFFKIRTKTNAPRKNHTAWRDQRKLAIKIVEGRAEAEGRNMNHGAVSTKLLDFQKPFEDFYGKVVRVKVRNGPGARGLLLPPVFSGFAPTKKLYLENEKGNIRKLRMENVESVEIIGVDGK